MTDTRIWNTGIKKLEGNLWTLSWVAVIMNCRKARTSCWNILSLFALELYDEYSHGISLCFLCNRSRKSANRGILCLILQYSLQETFNTQHRLSNPPLEGNFDSNADFLGLFTGGVGFADSCVLLLSKIGFAECQCLLYWKLYGRIAEQQPQQR